MPRPLPLKKALPLMVSLCSSKLILWSNSAYSESPSQPPVKALPGLADIITKGNTFAEVKFMAHSRTKFVGGSELETRKLLRSLP